MRLWEKMFGRRRVGISLAEEAEAKAPNRTPPVLNPNLTTTPLYPLGNYFVFAQQGYSRNELIHAALRRILDAVAMTPLRIYDAHGEQLEDHPVRALIRRPNPFMGEHLFWEMIGLNLYLAGSAFAEKVRDRNNQVVELWPLRPDRVRIVPSNTDYIGGYIYEIAGKQYPIDRADMIHWKFPDPIYEYFGLSPLQAALRRIAIDNEMADFTKVMLQNFAVPPHYITTQQAIDQVTTDRAWTKWRQKFGGKNRGVPAFLQAGMDIKTVAYDMKQIAFPELDASSIKRVLVALGISPILLGQEATYANYAEARASFYEDTIQPLQSRLDDRLEAELLFADFGGQDMEAHFDWSQVAALRPARQVRHDNALKTLTAGAITINHFLAMIGEPPVDDGEVYLRPINVQAVPQNPAAPPDEPEEPLDDDQGEDADGVKRAFKGAHSQEAKRALQLGREKIAASWEPRFKEMARRVFSRSARDAMRAVNRSQKALSEDQKAAILAEIAELEREWKRLTQLEAESQSAGLAADAGDSVGAELGISFDLNNPAIMDFIRSYSYTFADKISATSADDVRQIILDATEQGLSIAELRDNLQAKFTDWDSSRAAMVARNETIRAANAGAVAAYRQAGVTLKVWIADSDPCDYCEALDGKVIGIDQNFLAKGDAFQPQGAERAMNVTYEDVGFPPAHPNCRCTVGAEVRR